MGRSAFLAILSIWQLCARKKQYLIAILCILTLVLGIAFSILLFLPISDLQKEFVVTITSEPPGAKLYPTYTGRQDSFGTTPLELILSCNIDRDGSGYKTAGHGIHMESTEEEFLIRLDCYIAKEGYECQKLNSILATIPKKSLSDKWPSKLTYNAKLIPNVITEKDIVGTAIIVDG